ncbi:peroxiredoxin [Pseudoclavibacter chungangensis]|uniref:thioredoxin-dependent peroxiredoxin n=1 Tax=Pseudoclavibacter chungangensis TaxID=587635 RepID=A0A7J5C128_9MICO|nr:peroxiredoxin [Pseudoclavibacter chungangensis]KAB1659510.1 peroxiredoxin [Pseudoclavibacter chungangensis]NYJ67629.1 peroxiredoxin Q/BCP [Pseudoclavibacter chungangensis]
MTTDTPIRLEPGTTAPDFDLPAADGTRVSLAGLRGKRVVLYTYPEAATPGCTTEACDFRDSYRPLIDAGYTLIGISSDSPEKNTAFAEAEHLPFPLLSDTDHAVQTAYGAYGERNKYGRIAVGPIRSTFVIDADGRIEHALYNVRATGHVARVRKVLGLDAA